MEHQYGRFRFWNAAIAVTGMLVAAIHMGCSGRPSTGTVSEDGPGSSDSVTLQGGPAATEAVADKPTVTEPVADKAGRPAVTRQPTVKGPKPLKVVILAGQSNMQKPAGWGTLKGLADSPETKHLYDKLVDENGKVRIHKDVYETVFEFKRGEDGKVIRDEEGNNIPAPSYGSPLPYKFGGKVLGVDKEGGSYGPELGFGVALHETLQEPILIIKTAWGGKSLNYHFRPPNTPEWEPPGDHPDHPDNAPPPLPIPTSFEMPADFEPPARGKNMQIMSGRTMGEVNGNHPIYVYGGYGEKANFKSIPFEKGDVILGLNGEGLPENPVNHWRNLWFNTVRKGDWMLKVTRWRAGKIETIDIDTALLLKGGRADIPAYVAEQEAARAKLLKEGGEYYGMMMERIKHVLADPGRHHPEYDPEQGYEIAGFVWFHGYNDIIAGGVYPNFDKPRGYEQYSWLLAHLIRNVRKELNAPHMPVVIGVFGQGGKLDKPHPFREAQAALAGYDEFKGTVAAVRTAEFWDTRIPEIQGKLDRVMQYAGGDPDHPYAKLQAAIRAYREKMGDPSKLEGKQRGRLERAIKAGILDVVRTPEETEYLRNNVSNQGYHYYGSPKFFVRAGVAFARALCDMRQ